MTGDEVIRLRKPGNEEYGDIWGSWSVTFSQDDKVIASDEHEGPTVYELDTGIRSRIKRRGYSIIWRSQYHAFHAQEAMGRSNVLLDGQLWPIGRSDGSFLLIDIKNRELLRHFTTHDRGLFCVSVSPDGQYIATGGDEGLIRLWGL